MVEQGKQSPSICDASDMCTTSRASPSRAAENTTSILSSLAQYTTAGVREQTASSTIRRSMHHTYGSVDHLGSVDYNVSYSQILDGLMQLSDRYLACRVRVS